MKKKEMHYLLCLMTQSLHKNESPEKNSMKYKEIKIIARNFPKPRAAGSNPAGCTRFPGLFRINHFLEFGKKVRFVQVKWSFFAQNLHTNLIINSLIIINKMKGLKKKLTSCYTPVRIFDAPVLRQLKWF